MCICRTVSLFTLLLMDALGYLVLAIVTREAIGRDVVSFSVIHSEVVSTVGDMVLISCLEVSTLISIAAAQVYAPTSSQ